MHKIWQHRTTRRKVLLASAGAAAMAGCVGDDDFLDDDDVDDRRRDDDDDRRRDGPDAIADRIPRAADTIGRVDAGIQEDPETVEVLEPLLGMEFGQGLEELEDTFEEETGLRLGDVDEAALFAWDLEDPGEENVGLVLRARWPVGDLVRAIEEEEGHDYRRERYAGEDDVLYEPVDEEPNDAPEPPSDDDVDPVDRVVRALRGTHGPRFRYLSHAQTGDAALIGVLGDEEYVIGNESAVLAALDVAYRDGRPLEGDLREAFDAGDDGFVNAASRVPADAIPPGPPDEDVDFESFEHASVVSVAYRTPPNEIEIAGEVWFDSAGRAVDAFENAERTKELVQEDVPEGEPFREIVDPIDISLDGNVIAFTYRIGTGELVELIETFGTGPPDPEPPTARFDTQYQHGELVIVHVGGDVLDADQVAFVSSRGEIPWNEVATDPGDEIVPGEVAVLLLNEHFDEGEQVEIHVIENGTRRVVDAVDIPAEADDEPVRDVPDANFDVYTDEEAIVVTHVGGETVPANQIRVYVGQPSATWEQQMNVAVVEPGDEWVLMREDYDWPVGEPVRVVWESRDGEELLAQGETE